MRKAILLLLLLAARPLFAQTAPEGIWQGYEGEWKHVSKQLIDLAEATPQDKFCAAHSGPSDVPTFRCAPCIPNRSTGSVDTSVQCKMPKKREKARNRGSVLWYLCPARKSARIKSGCRSHPPQGLECCSGSRPTGPNRIHEHR